MNRPTPDPSQEGSRHSAATCPFACWEGIGVSSWSQGMRESDSRLSQKRAGPDLQVLATLIKPDPNCSTDAVPCGKLLRCLMP